MKVNSISERPEGDIKHPLVKDIKPAMGSLSTKEDKEIAVYPGGDVVFINDDEVS